MKDKDYIDFLQYLFMNDMLKNMYIPFDKIVANYRVSKYKRCGNCINFKKSCQEVFTEADSLGCNSHESIHNIKKKRTIRKLFRRS